MSPKQIQNYQITDKETETRRPPQAVEAEESLLGSLMLDKSAIFKVADFLLLKDFYKGKHTDIYKSMIELFEKEEPIDVLTVASRLSDKGLLEKVGGNTYLTELVNKVPTAAHIMEYAKIVQRKRILRDLISASYDISQLGYNETDDVELILDQAEKRIFSIAQQHLTQDFVPVKSTLEEAFERIDTLSKHSGVPRGLPTGFSALDNILAGLQKSDLILLASRPAMGKCISGDAEIVNSNSGIVNKVEDVVKDKKNGILTLSQESKILSSEASDFIDNGIQPVFQVKTAMGKEIKTTITHPFLTIDGWKQLKDLNVGDRIGTARKLPVFGKGTMPLYQIKTMAYFIAEGGLTASNPKFTNGNKKIIKDFKENINCFPEIAVKKVQERKSPTYSISSTRIKDKERLKFFGNKLKKYLRRMNVSQADLAKKVGLSVATISFNLNGKHLPISENFLKILNFLKLSDKEKAFLKKEYDSIVLRNSVTEWISNLGLMGKHSVNKFIPEVIFTLDRKSVRIFLNRLFACDGSLWKDKAGHYHISYSSSSKKLITQVQHLLLRFGILAKVRKKRIKYKESIKISYELEIHDSENLLLFLKEIGMFTKKNKVKLAIEFTSKLQKNWTKDTIPIEIWNKILEEKGDRSWYSIYPEMGLPKSHNIHVLSRHPRRDTVLKLSKVLNSSELKKISESDVYWDRIISVKHIGEERVYDLTVPNTHNFIANDFIVHNSSLALNFAANIAINQKVPVGIFSLEMAKDQIVDRLIAGQSGLDLWRLRTGRVSQEDGDFDKIRAALGVLSEAPIFIDDNASMNVFQMRAMARRLQAREGLGLIIVDYLQLMEARNANDSVVRQVSEMSRALKILARELNIPVLAISQLSRAVERRSPPRPLLSDLRDSGSLEQDADVVMFIYREDRYREDSQKLNMADIIIAKHRNGPVGKAELYFDEKTVSFRSIDKRFSEE